MDLHYRRALAFEMYVRSGEYLDSGLTDAAQLAWNGRHHLSGGATTPLPPNLALLKGPSWTVPKQKRCMERNRFLKEMIRQAYLIFGEGSALNFPCPHAISTPELRLCLGQ